MNIGCIRMIAMAVALWGCGTGSLEDFPSFDECTIPDIQEFQLGTGANEFVSIGENGPVQLVAGFQGGYHIHASADFPDLSSRRVRLLVNLCQDGQVIARGREAASDEDTKSGFQANGVYVYLLHGYFASDVAEIDSTLVALLLTDDGREYRAGARVNPTCCVNLLNGEQPD